MENTPTQQQNGFTLIEFMLYISLSLVMLVLLGNIGINVLMNRERAESLQEIQYNAPRIFAIIASKIHEAESIAAPGEGEVTTSLSLQFSDPSEDPTVFDVVDGVVLMQEGTQEPVVLSTSGVLVASLSFESASDVGPSESVRISLQIGPTPKDNQPSPIGVFEFYTTVATRK